jgi:hypothetical protein
MKEITTAGVFVLGVLVGAVLVLIIAFLRSH